MINKILCFMWGHQYKKMLSMKRIVYQWVFDDYFECKHCGKMK